MKPPPPPKQRLRTIRTVAPEAYNAGAGQQNPNSKPLVMSLLIGAVLTLGLMLVLCAGGIGAAVAYKTFGGGASGSEDDGGDVSGSLEEIESESSGGNDAGSQKPNEAAENEKPAGRTEQTTTQDAPPDASPEEDAAEQGDSGDASSQPETDKKSGGSQGNAGDGGVSIPGATFFGISSTGERVIYVVDCSGSMEGLPLEKAKSEILRSVRSLLVSQKYMIIFFDEGEYPMYWPNSLPNLAEGTDENLQKTEQWVKNFTVGSGTDPTLAMQRAISFRPDSIFLLTDGEFDSSITDSIRDQNGGRSQINTISFITRDGERALKKIAEQNGGIYRHVP